MARKMGGRAGEKGLAMMSCGVGGGRVEGKEGGREGSATLA